MGCIGEGGLLKGFTGGCIKGVHWREGALNGGESIMGVHWTEGALQAFILGVVQQGGALH